MEACDFKLTKPLSRAQQGRLKRLLVIRGAAQQIASKIGVHVHTVSTAALGRSVKPTTAEKIIAFLETNPKL